MCQLYPRRCICFLILLAAAVSVTLNVEPLQAQESKQNDAASTDALNRAIDKMAKDLHRFLTAEVRADEIALGEFKASSKVASEVIKSLLTARLKKLGIAVVDTEKTTLVCQGSFFIDQSQDTALLSCKVCQGGRPVKKYQQLLFGVEDFALALAR